MYLFCFIFISNYSSFSSCYISNLHVFFCLFYRSKNCSSSMTLVLAVVFSYPKELTFIMCLWTSSRWGKMEEFMWWRRRCEVRGQEGQGEGGGVRWEFRWQREERLAVQGVMCDQGIFSCVRKVFSFWRKFIHCGEKYQPRFNVNINKSILFTLIFYRNNIGLEDSQKLLLPIYTIRNYGKSQDTGSIMQWVIHFFNKL